jgi:hypothetical protein
MGVVVLTIVWELVALIFHPLPVFLPSPLAVANRLARLPASSERWADIGISVARVLAGFALGALSGIAVARTQPFRRPESQISADRAALRRRHVEQARTCRRADRRESGPPSRPNERRVRSGDAGRLRTPHDECPRRLKLPAPGLRVSARRRCAHGRMYA